MTPFFQKLFIRYPVRTRRFLEMLPGIMSWTLILLPVWGALLIPTLLAYFILFFDVYWFYKSFSLVVTAQIASRKIKESEKTNWYEKSRDLPHIDDVHHILIIPTYKESIEKLSKTLSTLSHQSFPHKQLHLVLGMEEREENVHEKAANLVKAFEGQFGSVFATFHPDVLGEVKGKSSNESYAGREAYRILFEQGHLDINYGTISSVDADSIFDKEYFANLAYLFLTDKKPYNKFWQSAIVFYNNMWQVPAPTRIISFFGGLYRTALLIQGDKCLTHATYSTSMKLMHGVGFWDVDVIPEDYRIFFKAFYAMKGQVWVEPIFLKTSLDAVQSHGYINSLKSRYDQERRWAWGVSDQPLFIKWWLTVPEIPFMRKTALLSMVLMDHVLWPVHWFIITAAANIIPLVNPVFSRTSLGLMLPRLAGSILTFGFIAIVLLIYIDYKNRPSHIVLPWYRKLIFPFEFILMPLIGFFLSALPALISHTQLMFGKRMEYKVTEKI
jgi:hypothetical protein